jgi:hypothetical protein
VTAPKLVACIPQGGVAPDVADAFNVHLAPYTGSVAGKCHECGCGVWVGPRQATVLAACPDILVYCLPCAAALMNRWGCGEVRHLGNPERPGE